ncbi:hypothetical protein PGT21_016679 [Puccinia graminis f. sp. tritici]|uniref:Uncharacterized protein n=1 Tax=Puccinia graminis f. sp. tritici TaxID=56615 RepID=A0A5B0R1I0_PUCGR|nr:hypothetical protein PGT21_016679 [Puccinia graminis f. sp. tritici]
MYQSCHRCDRTRSAIIAPSLWVSFTICRSVTVSLSAGTRPTASFNPSWPASRFRWVSVQFCHNSTDPCINLDSSKQVHDAVTDLHPPLVLSSISDPSWLVNPTLLDRPIP